MSLEFAYYSLADLVKIKYGKNQKKVQDDDNGKYPIFGTGGLMGFSKEYLYDKPSVLIGRKGSIEKVRYVDEPFWTVDTLFYTEVNENIVIPKFLYYMMYLMDLSRYNEGTSIPSLRTETLNRLEFPVPPLEYQNKVLSILNNIDKKIELNNELNHNLEKIETFFEEQDWKNYTILVHSIKSSSMNIGAEALSELAKKLEAAGKKEDISYILENHAEMTAEYRRVVQVIKEGLPKPEEQDEEADMAEDLMELGEEEFQNYATAFENAMFELDGDTMTEILDELVKYQYRGMVLREKLVSIRKKVEMSDYMAAADSLMELGGMNQ